MTLVVLPGLPERLKPPLHRTPRSDEFNRSPHLVRTRSPGAVRIPRPLTPNTLFYGDNLAVLREHFLDESVDLFYLDPPFNSNRSYNVLFKDKSGLAAEAQIIAFDDSWHWGPSAEAAYTQLVRDNPGKVSVRNWRL